MTGHCPSTFAHVWKPFSKLTGLRVPGMAAKRHLPYVPVRICVGVTPAGFYRKGNPGAFLYGEEKPPTQLHRRFYLTIRYPF